MGRFSHIGVSPLTTALAWLAITGLTTACGTSVHQPPTVQPQGDTSITPAQQARAELEHPRYTAAGGQFMSGMIGHHQQAIVMAGWAPSHGASPSVTELAERIAVSQGDEIKFMQDWLTKRHLVVPPADPRGYAMPGMDHPMLMPGMLTAAQMTELDAARDLHFDRLFLTDMIRHHRGAIDMVHQLTESGQEEDDALVMYATNVEADQAAEIARMQRMLAAMAPDADVSGSAH